MTFDKIKYDNNYQKENYDRIILNVPKGERNKITEHYKKSGYKSMNEYIKALIYHDMNGGGTEKELSENLSAGEQDPA